jgi:hypothetical protein
VEGTDRKPRDALNLKFHENELYHLGAAIRKLIGICSLIVTLPYKCRPIRSMRESPDRPAKVRIVYGARVLDHYHRRSDRNSK